METIELNQQTPSLQNPNKDFNSTSLNILMLIDSLKNGKLLAQNFTEQENRELIALTNSLNKICMEDLLCNHHLTNQDIQYLCLLLLGFTTSEMATIFECSNHAVSKRKGRLKKKLFLEDSANLEKAIRALSASITFNS